MSRSRADQLRHQLHRLQPVARGRGTCSSQRACSAGDQTSRSGSGTGAPPDRRAGAAGQREPDHVPAVGLVPGAPRGREPRDQAQPATVGGGPPVAGARLGEVQLQRPGAAVGDGHGDLGASASTRELELGAGMQHGVLAQLAGQQHRGVGESGSAARRPRRPAVLQHAPRLAGGPGVGRQPDPPLERTGTACSLHGARRDARRRSRQSRSDSTAAARGGHCAARPIPAVPGRRHGRIRDHDDGPTRRRPVPADRRRRPADAVLAELAEALRRVRRGRFDVAAAAAGGRAGEVVERSTSWSRCRSGTTATCCGSAGSSAGRAG